MKQFWTKSQDYTSICYWCKKTISAGSDKIRRSVKDVINFKLPTKNHDFHPECNDKFQQIYIPIRDGWAKVEPFEIEE